jgi:hypothetical protein
MIVLQTTRLSAWLGDAIVVRRIAPSAAILSVFIVPSVVVLVQALGLSALRRLRIFGQQDKL